MKARDRGKPESYKCRDPPCIHIVFDDRRKLFRVFIEDYDYIIPIDLSKLKKICEMLAEDHRLKRYREASYEEEEYLARKYLEAAPIEEEKSEDYE